jgi:serine/threonine-protein kinase
MERGMAEPAQQELISERYRLLRVLGRGGMGSVWEAEDERLGRRVALKLMIARLARDDKALRRFEREARAVAVLKSPHIVQLLDFGVDRVPYMVLELLEGCELKERLHDAERLPLPVVARIVTQTARALSTAHDAGIVHRDLKPANIFLARDHDDEYVKVFDFGTAKALTGFKDARTLTTLGSILGTPHYMAPEQLGGDDDTDHRADVWSLAVVAYHALTGFHPFPGDEIGEVIQGILYARHVPPTSLNPDLPADVDVFFDQALCKVRQARFDSARSLSAAFDAIAGNGSTSDEEKTRVRVAQPTRRGIPAVGSLLGKLKAPSPEEADQEAASAWAALDSLTATAPPASLPPPVRPKPLPRAAIGVGAALSLAVGGFLAWLALERGALGLVPPPTAATAAPFSTLIPSALPPPAVSLEPSSAPTASASSAPKVPFRRWRRPDIYEDLDD